MITELNYIFSAEVEAFARYDVIAILIEDHETALVT